MSQNEIITIEGKVRMINQYESIAKDAEAKADAIRSEIKDFMTSRDMDTITTPNFVIRWIDVISNRFDTKRFKLTYGDAAYAAFCKQVPSKKFTITQ